MHAYIGCLAAAAAAGSNGDCTSFREFQPQSNNAAGSFVVPKTAVLSLTMVLKSKYASMRVYIHATCVSTRILVCIHTYMYIYIYTFIYVYIYVYIYTFVDV